MSKIYIADKGTQDHIAAILSAEPVYGFIEHCAVSAPGSRIEYIGANKSFSPITVTMGGGYTLGDWADFPWLKGNKPYMVKSDGTPDYRLKETDYTLREDGTASDVANTSYAGGAYAWCPKIYKREYMAGDDRYVLFRFEPADGFLPVGFVDGDGHELEGVWLPMFYGALVNDGTNDVMRSLSGLQPSYGLTTAEQKAAIDAAGTRARFFGGGIIGTLIDLEILFSKTTDLQGFYGMGNSAGFDGSLSPTYGVLQNAVVGGGQFYGTSDGNSLNKIFHSVVPGSYQAYLRDPYTLLVNGRFKVSKDYGYDLTGANYADTGVNVPVPASGGWSYPNRYRTVPGFGHLPDCPYGGSAETGGCDGFYRSNSFANQTLVAIRFGTCANGNIAGGRCLTMGYKATHTLWNVSAAVLFLPPAGVTA
ncbi:MAG: hypothetical protein IJT27_00590 [Clostridia bacterium]|nr:hypothetical protein [Clostridia bacterium]